MNRFLCFFLVVFVVGCGRIETGNVGVRTDFNKSVNTTEINPGWYAALFTSVTEYSVKEIEIALNDMRPKAKDNLSLADLDVSVFYKMSPDKVSEMAIKYSGMQERFDDGTWAPSFGLVTRFARGAVYDEIAKYDSLTVHTKRTELENGVLGAIQSTLNKDDPDTFTITKVVVRQLTTDQSLEESIRTTVKVQKEIEAKNQQVLLAVAEAKRLNVEAEGQAVANKTIAASITPQLIELRRIEAMQKFAGEGTHTVVLPSDTRALVQIK